MIILSSNIYDKTDMFMTRKRVVLLAYAYAMIVFFSRVRTAIYDKLSHLQELFMLDAKPSPEY